jgi:hypothetical protein
MVGPLVVGIRIMDGGSGDAWTGEERSMRDFAAVVGVARSGRPGRVVITTGVSRVSAESTTCSGFTCEETGAEGVNVPLDLQADIPIRGIFGLRVALHAGVGTVSYVGGAVGVVLRSF